MLFFYPFVFFLCLSSFLSQISLARSTIQIDVTAHTNDLRLGKRGDTSTETFVTNPFRLRDNLDSDLGSNFNHFRKRRSTLSDESSTTDDDFSNPIYKIQAFEKELIVRLQPDRAFIAPSFTAVYSWKHRSVNNTNASFLQSSSLEHCFFKGEVDGEKNSQVALSICNSLTGSIRTKDFLYFISPLQNFTAAEFSENSALIPHSIQRRSLKKNSNNQKYHSSCGVNESRNRRRYKRSSSNAITRNRGKAFAKRSIFGDDFRNPTAFDENQKHSRKKRSFQSRQYYIETMVVADASMVEEHGSNLEHYILSILMMANKVYSHPSLGSAISLNVVKIMVLDEDDSSLRISSNAAHALRNFCFWQTQHNRADDTDPQHYDLAILMTKKDLCSDSCDTLGMAEVGAVCSSRHSCAIVEDDGLSASQTIAHEVGHVLDMMHDDSRVCLDNFSSLQPRSHIMSSTISRIDSDQPWSMCSKKSVTDFLQDGRGDCLLDKPQKPKVYPTELPGVTYDVAYQCEMAFGRGAVECPYMRECSRLWCQIPTGTRANQCHTRNFPRADGSPCSPGNHCMQGKCVPKSHKLIAVNGGWGSWSQYGPCSRSCGGGVQQSSRQCNNPTPQHGGRYCIGSRLQFRSCNTNHCPRVNGREPSDFRSEQCAAYNGQRFPLLGVRVASTWIPKYSDIFHKDRCKLICESLQTGTYITLADRVVDGTRCGLDTTDICVHGQCMPAGCDGVLGSKAKYNKCGLCNTSNRQCARVQGKYSKRLSGYNDVFTFPEGAASIKIQQKSFRNQIHDGNYLALVKPNGHYILNGGLTLTTIKKDIKVNGTVLQYSGVQVPTEKITSTMPLKEPITLQVLSLGLTGTTIFPPKIRYSYYIAKPLASSKQAKVRTKSTGRNANGPGSRIPSEPSEPTPSSQPEVSRWVTGRWRKCKVIGDKKCGVGWRKRKVTCRAGKKRSNRCDAHLKPYQRLPCYVSDCPTEPPNRRPGINGAPRNEGPAIVNRFGDEIPIWNAGMWGSCSVSCGFGTKWRQVICQTRSGRLLSLAKCNQKTRPASAHGCKLRSCG